MSINKVKISGSRDSETTGLKRKVLDRQIEKQKETDRNRNTNKN